MPVCFVAIYHGLNYPAHLGLIWIGMAKMCVRTERLFCKTEVSKGLALKSLLTFIQELVLLSVQMKGLNKNRQIVSEL